MARFEVVERAANAALQTPAVPRPLTLLERELQKEIDYALAAGNIAALPALNRLRDVAGLPADPRIGNMLAAAREKRLRGRHV